MKKRRTKLTMRAKRARTSNKFDLNGFKNALRNMPDRVRPYDHHVIRYRAFESGVAHWKAINAAINSHPGGVLVDIPWLQFWESTRDLNEDDYSQAFSGVWLDDAQTAKDRSRKLTFLRSKGRHHNEVDHIHKPLLQDLRERMDENILAIGRGCAHPIDDFAALCKTPGRVMPIDYMFIRFVLPDEHDATMFKLRWG